MFKQHESSLRLLEIRLTHLNMNLSTTSAKAGFWNLLNNGEIAFLSFKIAPQKYSLGHFYTCHLMQVRLLLDAWIESFKTCHFFILVYSIVFFFILMSDYLSIAFYLCFRWAQWIKYNINALRRTESIL